MRDAAAIAASAVLVLAGLALAVTGLWWEVWLIGFPLIYGGVRGIIGTIGKLKSNQRK